RLTRHGSTPASALRSPYSALGTVYGLDRHRPTGRRHRPAPAAVRRRETACRTDLERGPADEPKPPGPRGGDVVLPHAHGRSFAALPPPAGDARRGGLRHQRMP